jgi:hypothetical protein
LREALAASLEERRQEQYRKTTAMTDRWRVLLIAEACNPTWTSVLVIRGTDS